MARINNMEFSLLPIPLLTIHKDGKISSANLAAQECLGVSERRLTGKMLQQIFLPSSEIETLLQRIVDYHGLFSGHHILYHASDQPYSLHFGKEHHQTFVALIPETGRAEMEEQAKRFEMSDSVARIALEMAHEIKNPLTALSGAAQWLSSQRLTDEHGEALSMIRAEATRIRDRIDTFLQLAPRANFEMSSVNIHNLIDDVCKGHGMDYQCTYDPSLPELQGHEGRLRQAIENLWHNALEASASKIEWQTRVTPMTNTLKHLGAIIEVRLINNGTSIPSKLLPHLFEPFVTGKKRGSGLGLAIVQQIVIEHQGRVNVRSERGRTSFTMHLPINPPLQNNLQHKGAQ
ncbi:MAG: ATP-binding protein [Mariprofundaceae bacterium]